MNLFERASSVGLNYIKLWLPDGEEENGQWSAINPLRNDKQKGSFKINLTTGAFNDYADDDMVGRDAVTLYAKLNGLSNFEAAKQILEKYDPSYFPTEYSKDEIKEEWRQVTRPVRKAPELPIQKNEIARWPLELKHGDDWLPVMWVVRIMKGDSKTDYPYTLFSNAKNYEWRCKALHGVKYPLYNSRSLIEKPNARVLLVEGQKVAGIIKDILTEWAVVGWYGGAKSIGLSDLSGLIGREVYFAFDADTPGRQAIEKINKLLPDTKVHLIYPPNDVEQGWDLADAIKDGWTKEELETHILKDVPAEQNSNVPALSIFAPCMSPLRFTPVTEDFKFNLRNLITEEKNSGIDKQTGTVITKTLLRDNWIGLWVENDLQLKNSIMQDYTTGLKQTAYDSKSEWLGAVEHRADELEIPQSNLTDSALKKIERAIELIGRKYNRVSDYMDTLKNVYKPLPDDDKLLDRFIAIFDFNIVRYDGEDIEDYEERKIHVIKCYKELWHKFFLKMHGHINGTRRHEDGSYYGLMENDIVPILAGGQGIGKTTLVRWLAMDNDLYTDLGSGLKAKFGAAETVKKVRGKLLVEIGEMKVMKNADDVEQVKSFISQTSVNVDIKYVEQQFPTPLTASYIGTANPQQYLSDSTGNRRWDPVKIKSVDMDFCSSEEGQAFIRRLHAHYARLADSMTTTEVREATRFSPELEALMEELRNEALITYSDYEACCKVIKLWLYGDTNRPAASVGDELLQADVEKLCWDYGYKMRISQKSCLRAMEDCGLKQLSKVENGKLRYTWVKSEPEEQLPF